MANIHNDNIAETVYTDMNHEIKNTDKAGVSREDIIINRYTSIKRLKRKPIWLIDTQEKENSTTTSNSLGNSDIHEQEVIEGGKTGFENSEVESDASNRLLKYSQ